MSLNLEHKTRPNIQLRLATEDDINFIFHSWLKSYRNSQVVRNLNNSVYYTEHHKVIEHTAKSAMFIIACAASDPLHLYGWACAEMIDGVFCLHYVYVKHAFRGLGIASILIQAFEHDFETMGIYSHKHNASDYFSKRFNLIYHPYVLYAPYANRAGGYLEFKTSETKPELNSNQTEYETEEADNE